MGKIGAVIAAAGLFPLPFAAQAQGIVGAAAQGAQKGGEAGGPSGQRLAVQWARLPGGVAGLLGVDQRPRFRDYVMRDLHNDCFICKPKPMRTSAVFIIPSLLVVHSNSDSFSAFRIEKASHRDLPSQRRALAALRFHHY